MHQCSHAGTGRCRWEQGNVGGWPAASLMRHGLGRAISYVMWLSFPDPEIGFNRITDESGLQIRGHFGF